MESNAPIDVEEIEIDKTELEQNRLRLKFTISGRLAKRFKKKMVKSGQDASGNKARNSLLLFCIQEAYKRFEITPLLEPVPSPNSAEPVISEKDPFVFSVDMDPMPAIDWPAFDTLELFIPEEEVTDVMIEEELETQGYMVGTRSSSSNLFEETGELTCSVSIVIENDPKPIYENSEVKIMIRKNQNHCFIGPYDFAELNEKLIGLSQGDEKSFDVTIPTGSMGSVAGDKATVSVQVQTVETISPATPERVAEVYGSNSVENLKQQIRYSLEDRIQLNQEEVLRDQVFVALAEKIDVVVSDAVMKEILKRQQRSKIAVLKSRGYENEKIKARLLADEEEDISKAFKQAKSRLLFIALREHLEITYEEEEVLEHIARKAAEVGKRPAEYREELIQSNKMNSVVESMTSLKCVEKVSQLAKITPISREEWNEKHAIS